MSHSYIFPQSYAPWLSQRLQGAMTETLATCNSCAMVKPEGLTRDPGPFSGTLKCCTYFPYIPNFTLGQFAFEDFKSLETRGELLPTGIYPSTDEQALILKKMKSGFGTDPDLLCPFYSKAQNQCSIWEYRPGVCTSYFCKSNRGQEGLSFWRNVESYLNHFEWKMAREVLFRLGFSENEMVFCRSVQSAETDEDEREFFREAAWLKPEFRKDKASFYQRCHEMAKQITGTEVGRLLEPKYLHLEEEMKAFLKT